MSTQKLHIIQVGDVLVSPDIITEQFCCDLDQCKGQCCVEGDAGAPVTLDEIAAIEDSLDTVWNDMSATAQAVVDKQGVAYTDRDGELVARWMKQLKECYTYAIGEQRQEWMNDVFDAGYCDDMQCADEIRARFEQDHYLMDTHTAVASHVLKEYRERTGDLTPAVVVSTASPYKFAADVLSAVAGSDAANGLDAFECSEKLEQLSGVQIPQQVKALRSLPVRHRQQCQKDQMAAAVLEAFGK